MFRDSENIYWMDEGFIEIKKDESIKEMIEWLER